MRDASSKILAMVPLHNSIMQRCIPFCRRRSTIGRRPPAVTLVAPAAAGDDAAPGKVGFCSTNGQ
jgi:hypothetical protein